MAAYEVTLKHHKTVADDTMAFYFERPAEFAYKAGQSIDLTLVDPPETDDQGNTRAFSLISAPFEDELGIATRLRNSAYKRVLKSLPPEARLRISGPFGSFNLHNNASRPAVLLAGGIGITPFMSIIKTADHDQLPHRLTLLYSNKSPEQCAFLQELTALAGRNPRFDLIATMTDLSASASGWDGPTGHIDGALLQRAGDLHAAIYYIAGPAGFVSEMRRLLNNAAVDDDDIRTEEFPGY